MRSHTIGSRVIAPGVRARRASCIASSAGRKVAGSTSSTDPDGGCWNRAVGASISNRHASMAGPYP